MKQGTVVISTEIHVMCETNLKMKQDAVLFSTVLAVLMI